MYSHTELKSFSTCGGLLHVAVERCDSFS